MSLTPVEKVVAALITNPSYTATAEALGISTKTLSRVMNSPDVKQKYREARRSMVRQAIAAVQHATADAVQTIHRLITGNKVPVWVKLHAASKIIELSLRAVQDEDLEDRLEKLESSINPLTKAEAHSLEDELEEDYESEFDDPVEEPGEHEPASSDPDGA